MKKVLIGILILIPILILLVVALVTNMLQLQAWIAVEDMLVTDRANGKAVNALQLYLDVRDGTVFNFKDFVKVVVLPEKANQYTVEWEITNVECTDDDYQQEYEDYLDDPVGTPVHPAAMLVDGEGREAQINASGDFKINAYCNFNVTVRAETVTRNFAVNIVGNTVHSVSLVDLDGGTDGRLVVGESKRLSASYVPVDSIITRLDYSSSDPDCVSVDENGVLTALSAGVATISVSADKYQEDGTVTSNNYTVTVDPAASKYGNFVNLPAVAGGKYALDLLGISASDIDVDACVGCTIGDGITVNGETATVAMKDGKRLEITICDAADIQILHGDIFDWKDGEGNYVLGVDERGLKLSAAFVSSIAEGQPQGVVWSTSDESVATVGEDGMVKGVSNGTATITATCGGKTGSVTLNVQKKETYLRLKTSNEALEVGLARQTVFAAERYKFQTNAEGGERYREKEPNSALILLQGEPEDGTAEDIAAFYARYDFLIEEGGDYAHFDSDVPNKIVFDPAALEGKGMVQIKVVATAKYPRFETNRRHTTDRVTLNAVYGVEASTFEQAVRAGEDQKEYACREDNVIPAEILDEFHAPNGGTYYVRMQQRTRRTYALTLSANMRPADGVKLSYKSDVGQCVKLYGDLYGNGHMIYATPEQSDCDSSYLVHASMSGILISNVQLRHEEVEIEKLDAKTFEHDYCLVVEDEGGQSTRITDVRAEYCIFENSRGGVTLRNADLEMDGCVVRNISSSGVYSHARIIDGEYIDFSHLNINNTVFSSVISISISFVFQGFSVNHDNNMGLFSSITPAGSTATDAEISASRAESVAWVEQNLVPKGYVHRINQTGFLDIYNWQDASKANLIDTGDQTTNQLISAFAGPMIQMHPAFRQGVYHYKSLDYFHMGFITAGIWFPLLNEPVFTQVTLEDDRFFCLYSRDLDLDAEVGEGYLALQILHRTELYLYSYKNTSSITPGSTYVMNSQFVSHLHEK